MILRGFVNSTIFGCYFKVYIICYFYFILNNVWGMDDEGIYVGFGGITFI
jgi:hypothetical protein